MADTISLQAELDQPVQVVQAISAVDLVPIGSEFAQVSKALEL